MYILEAENIPTATIQNRYTLVYAQIDCISRNSNKKVSSAGVQLLIRINRRVAGAFVRL